MYANQTPDSFSFQRRRDKMFFPGWLGTTRPTGSATPAAKVARSYERIRTQTAQGVPAGRLRALAGRDGSGHRRSSCTPTGSSRRPRDTLVDFKLIVAEGNADAADRKRVAARRAQAPRDRAVGRTGGPARRGARR